MQKNIFRQLGFGYVHTWRIFHLLRWTGSVKNSFMLEAKAVNLLMWNSPNIILLNSTIFGGVIKIIVILQRKQMVLTIGMSLAMSWKRSVDATHVKIAAVLITYCMNHQESYMDFRVHTYYLLGDGLFCYHWL